MSPGEALDKASILRIKMRKLNVDLSGEIAACLRVVNGRDVSEHMRLLDEVNEIGWTANEVLFQAYDKPLPVSFQEAMRLLNVWRTAHWANMRRVRIKNAINKEFGHHEKEVKSWGA